MRFYFDAIGTREEVLKQLGNAGVEGNKFASRIRDAIAEGIGSEPEIHQKGFEDRYSISVQGNSGQEGSPLTLSVTIQSRYMPKADSS